MRSQDVSRPGCLQPSVFQSSQSTASSLGFGINTGFWRWQERSGGAIKSCPASAVLQSAAAWKNPSEEAVGLASHPSTPSPAQEQPGMEYIRERASFCLLAVCVHIKQRCLETALGNTSLTAALKTAQLQLSGAVSSLPSSTAPKRCSGEPRRGKLADTNHTLAPPTDHRKGIPVSLLSYGTLPQILPGLCHPRVGCHHPTWWSRNLAPAMPLR